ncbi:hypothetical protein [Ornithinibacillus caprae]|nr:hypothetical protein [Ornithinibacillus caprae]
MSESKSSQMTPNLAQQLLKNENVYLTEEGKRLLQELSKKR